MDICSPVVRRVLLCCLAALLTLGAEAQSVEDVHIAPKPQAAEPAQAVQPAASRETLPLRPKPLRHDVDLVLVPVTVTDSYNRLVSGLDKKDFLLRENGAEQDIQYFSTEDGPISLGVILDVSKSMKNKMDDARDAALQFFESANPQDDYFVITFADYPELLADTSRSVGFVRERLATVVPDGHTAMLDAIYLGITKLRHARHGRRALLVISDGGDNHSRYTERELKKLVEEADVEIYGIGIFDRMLGLLSPPEERDGKRLLAAVSEATGGRLITLHSAKELPEIAAQVSLELRNQYVLGYRPGNGARDGKWRPIDVVLTTADGRRLHIHAKRGYTAAGE
jgi:Ca-activated chloride channel homolog